VNELLVEPGGAEPYSLPVPRYLIERNFEVGEEEMPDVSRKSKRTIEGMPGIVWEFSHVIVEDSGLVTTFCVYVAPDEEAVRRHAEALGAHRIGFIREIAADVTPADFPL
jgi:hypothetical protein